MSRFPLFMAIGALCAASAAGAQSLDVHAGRVIDPDNDEEQVAAIRETNDLIAADERVDCAMVAIADGLMLARKR